MCAVPRHSQASTKFPKTKRDAIACASTKEHNYLNFAETRSPKPSRLTHTSLSHHCPCKLSLLARVGSTASTNTKPETSRTIIRATWLHLLPGLHLWSIYQVFFLGS